MEQESPIYKRLADDYHALAEAVCQLHPLREFPGEVVEIKAFGWNQLLDVVKDQGLVMESERHVCDAECVACEHGDHDACERDCHAGED